MMSGALRLVEDLLRDGVEARGAVVRIEILGVVACDRQPVGAADQRGGFLHQRARLLDREGLRRDHLIVAEVVVDDAGDVAELRADVDVGRDEAREHAVVVVDLQAFRIEVAAGDVDVAEVRRAGLRSASAPRLLSSAPLTPLARFASLSTTV